MSVGCILVIDLIDDRFSPKDHHSNSLNTKLVLLQNHAQQYGICRNPKLDTGLACIFKRIFFFLWPWMVSQHVRNYFPWWVTFQITSYAYFQMLGINHPSLSKFVTLTFCDAQAQICVIKTESDTRLTEHTALFACLTAYGSTYTTLSM